MITRIVTTALISAGLTAAWCCSAASFSIRPSPAFSRSPLASFLSVPADSSIQRADSSMADTMMSVWSIDELDRILTEESAVSGEPGRGGKKSSNRAVIYSLLFPGLGQIYNERPYKAIIAFGAEMFYFSRIYIEYRNGERERIERDRYEPGSREWLEHDIWVNEYEQRVIDWIWWAAGSMLVVTLDAYVDAHLYDMKFKVEARPIDRGAGLTVGFDF